MNARNNNQFVLTEAKRLLDSLRALGRRGQILTLLSGLGWTLTGIVTLLVVFVASLGWFGGQELHAAGWIVLAVGSVLLCTKTLVRPMINLKRQGAVARHIGLSFPDLASDVLSANQLADSDHEQAFSAELVAGHLKNVTHCLEAIPGKEIFPLKPLFWPGVALVTVITLSGFAQNMYSSTVRTGLFSLWNQSKPPSTQIKQVSAKAPLVGDLKLTLKYPQYLQRLQRKLDGISGGVAAPVGTTVIIEGNSLVEDADRGLVNLPGGGTSRLSINSEAKVYGRFVVRDAGDFSLALGNQSIMLEGPKRSLEVEPDSPPSIRLLRPTTRVEVAEDGEVILELEAEDDHGIEHIDLVLRAGSDLELRKTIIHLADRVRRLKTQYRWTPESVRVADDIDLQLELEAYDNDSISGPKQGHSQPISVRILTPASRHKNAVSSQNDVLGALVDLLAKRLETPVPSNKRTAMAIDRFTKLSRETEDLLGKMAHLIRALNLDGMSPKRVADTFVQIRQDISNQLYGETNIHQGTIGNFRKRIAADKVTIRTLENSVIRVDDLIIEQQLSRVVQTGSALENQRSELVELLERYNRSRGEPARRALLEGIAKMEDALRRLEQEVQTIRSKVGDTFVNPSAHIQMDLIGILDKLRSLLAEGDLAKATSLIKNLDNDLSRLMAALEGGLLSFRTDRFGEGDRFIGELLDKVLAIESSQLQLRRETTAITRRVQERLVGIMRGRIDPLVKKQLKRARHMAKLTEKIESPSKEGGRLRLVRLRILSQELRLALGQGDLDETRQIATESVEIAEDWLLDSNAPNKTEIRDLKQTAEHIDEEVAGTYPKPAQLMTDRDRRLTKSYARKQRALTAKAKRLKAWSTNQKSAMRFISHRASGALSSVADHMSEATNSLAVKQVREATADQSAALDGLARLREDLKRGNELAPLKARPIVLHGRVKIPDPDDYEVPPEFRDEILKAMQSDLPGQYQSAIKKYYETLVQ